MQLKRITVSNYKSISKISFEIDELSDRSHTYGLIGVNEAGKSSLLQALALKDDPSFLGAKDYLEKGNPVVVTYLYEVDSTLAEEIMANLPEDIKISANGFSEVLISYEFRIENSLTPLVSIFFTSLEPEINEAINSNIKPIVLNKIQKSILWKAEPKYLISQPINLTEFSNNPEGVSIPLMNCFHLAGINDIKNRIDRIIGDSTEIEQLQTELGEKVTKHIKKVWKNHPVVITFIINDGHIYFHIKDDGEKGRAKTSDQRSDGFKQFVSFLLTISAQSSTGELSNSILLLDEPETHLHPKAQEYLLGELIEISKKGNNVVFFATHSNYIIDKNILDRNHRVSKGTNGTLSERLDSKKSSYASVNYEVFEIATNDYHNELYSELHAKYQYDDQKAKERERIKFFDEDFLQKIHHLPNTYPWRQNPKSATLPTYIRNCIDHPDSGNTFTTKDLETSINQLRKIKGI